jgi:hypothetical protein
MKQKTHDKINKLIINTKLDFLLDMIDLLMLGNEQFDAQIHEALLDASNLIYRATHPEEFEQ